MIIMTNSAVPIASTNFLGQLTELELADYFKHSPEERSLIKHFMTAPNSFQYSEAKNFIEIT